ncbi:MAG: PAS domain S-box protein [Planctomycetaceae bacterium]|jgi:PAS domain S-box-containing protein|nr:PAS domain S-box protein [Planctomycetaceae bacterium]MBT6155595.1 PAS domain S-box protein [Planctomycetaceae bacterium]MBT6483415.1 PAS domain S-box protein [Planctomycetaceae bacterium]MBT6494221.1 PAS domain S-box protein [Planctomycetaceae bacterium]
MSNATKAKLQEEVNRLRDRIAELERQLPPDPRFTRPVVDNTTHGLSGEYDRLRRNYRKEPVGLCCFDTELRYLDINEFLATLNGLSVEEHLGRSVGELFPELAAEIEPQLRQVIETGEPIRDGSVIAGTADQPGEKRYFQHNYVALRSDDGNVIGVSCAVTDITDRKRAEEELARREELYRRVIDGADSFAYQLDYITDRYVFHDAGIESLIGYKSEEMTHERWTEVCVELQGRGECAELSYDEAFRRYLAGEIDVWKADCLCRTRDGSLQWIYDVAVPVFNDQGVVTGSLGILHDLTERKQAEEDLRRSEEKFRRLTEDIPVSLSIVQDGQRVFTNKSAKRVTGYSRDELMQMTPGQLLDREAHERYSKMVQECREQGVTSRGEFRGKDKEGNERWVDYSVTQIEYEQRPALLGASIDITDRKQVEKELRTTTDQLRIILDALPVISYTCRPDGDFGATFVGGNVLQLTGFSADKFTADPSFWADRIHPDDAPGVFEGLANLFERGFHEHEYRWKIEDGTYLVFHDNLRVVKHADGSPSHLVGAWQDVTEGKLVTDALQRNEEQYRTLAENSKDYILRYDREYRHTYANSAALQISGKTAAEYIGKTHREMGFPDHLCQLWENAIDRVFATNQPQGEIFDWTSSEGTATYDWRVFPELNGAGEVVSVLGVSRDISELKRVADELRESEERLNLAVRGTSDGLWDWSIETGKEYWSPRFKELLGYGEGIETTCDQCLAFVHPEDKADVLEAVRLHLEENLPYDCEYRLRTRCGEYRWFQARGEAMRDEDGKPYRMAGSIRDITERKVIEESLLESQRFLSKAEAMAQVGHWRLVPENGEIIGSDSLFDIFGISREEASLDSFLNAVHPEDREYDLYHIQRGIDYGEDWNIEHRLLLKDGTISVVQAIGEAVVDETGKTVLLVGTVQDITARKQLEEKVRQHQEQLAHVARLSTMGEMATGIAHELNQPLTAIATYSHIVKHMLNAPTTDRQGIQKTLDKLEGQTLRAGDIVWRLRNFVQKSPSNRVPTDLNALVKDVARFVDSDIRQADVSLQLSLGDACPIANVDAIQIQQVLVNLVRNAIDAMDEMPNDRRTVTVTTQISEDNLVDVSVCDVGKGLREGEFELVFDAFYSTKRQGMGMGLAISRSIIEEHGGRLWAESNRTTGTTFRFTIPHGDSHGGQE